LFSTLFVQIPSQHYQLAAFCEVHHAGRRCSRDEVIWNCATKLIDRVNKYVKQRLQTLYGSFVLLSAMKLQLSEIDIYMARNSLHHVY
jgi:hypothetical protein